MNKDVQKIGLNVPLFVASLTSIFIGAPILGLTGVWGYLVQGKFVPAYLKVLHAHIAWWSIVILIASLIIPHIPLKPLIKRLIIIYSFVGIPFYVVSMVLHYNTAHPVVMNLGYFGSFYLTIFGAGVFAIEVGFFTTMLLLGLLAGGFNLPFLTTKEPTISRYEIVSEIEMPRKIFRGYTFFLSLAVIMGLIILFSFTLQHKPVFPAALVQLHTHLGFFSIGLVMVTLAMKTVGADASKIDFAYKLGITATSLTALGLLIFIFFKTHSAVWILPAMLYWYVLFLGWRALWGRFGLRPQVNNFLRFALIFIWSALLFFILVGPLLGLVHDVSPDLTVTYKQPEGSLHVGPYPDPEKYLGTAPVKNTPRGLENLHLSPGSWSHVAIFWLIILLIFGEKILKTIGKPNLMFLLAITISEAPVFNAIGRIGAWANLPGGPGPLYLVAHPIKTLNILMLLFTMIAWMKKIRMKEP